MFNIETNVSESVGIVEPIVGTENGLFPWEDFGRRFANQRTENQKMQNFAIVKTKIGNENSAFGLNWRALTNSRMARTEIHVEGRFLCNNSGLQWYAICCNFNTKDRISGSACVRHIPRKY